MIFKKTTNKIKKFLVAAILSISMTGVATAAVEWNTAVTSAVSYTHLRAHET